MTVVVMLVIVRAAERGNERGERAAVLTGFLQITGTLTAMESNGAGRAESITGHNTFSHRSELGKAALECSADSWHRSSTGKGAGSQRNNSIKTSQLVILHHTVVILSHGRRSLPTFICCTLSKSPQHFFSVDCLLAVLWGLDDKKITTDC